MKRLLFVTTIFLSSMICVMGQYQPAKWDSTYRPSTYYRLVDQFKSFNHRTNDIVFLGNSITYGVDWCELLELPQARNRGISGDMTFGVLERLQEIIDGKPAKLFIMIGINDVLRNVPDKIVIENYKKIVSRIKKGTPQTQIYIQSLLPVNEWFSQHKSIIGKRDRIIAVNKSLKELARENRATYIDLYHEFSDPELQLEVELTYDGLHLSLAGYQLWKKVLEDGNYLNEQ